MRRGTTIRAHLLRLILAAALPMAAVMSWNVYDSAQESSQRAREQVFRLAQVTASETAKFLGQARNILNGMASRPAVRALDPARCDPILKDFLGLAPRFANVVTMAADATVVCSAVPLIGPARGNPDRLMKLLRPPDELTVGKAAPGVITGRWVVPIGRPLLDARGGIAGAVVLTVDLLTLPVLPSLEGLPGDAVVALAAGDGTILARSLAAERFVGTRVDAGRPALREKIGTAAAIGVDGIARIQGFAPVPGTDWIAVASLPASAVYASVSGRAISSALIAIAALFAVLVIAFRLGRRIQVPIVAIADAADEVAAGNLAARAPVAGPAEIAHVAVQFNGMLDARTAAEAGLRDEERVARANAERFEKIFRAAPLPMTITAEATGSLIDVNDAFCALFGYAREETIGRTTLGLGLWADPADREMMAELLRGGARVRDFETRRRLRSGELRDVVVNTDRIELAGERCVLATLNDVTGRRTAEREMHAARVRFQKIFHAAPLPCVVSTLKEGRVLEVNDAYCKLVGIARDALVGCSVLDLGTWSDPAERAALVEQLHLYPRVEDFEIHVRDGADGIRNVLVSAERIDFSGESCSLQIGVDITERKRAETALRESEAGLRQAQLLAKLGYAITLSDSAIESSSETLAKLIGVEPSRVPKSVREWLTLLHPEDRALFHGKAIEAAKYGTRWDIEYRLRRGDGAWAHFRHVIEPLQSEAGAAGRARWFNMVQDITQHKLAEMTLRENEAKYRTLVESASDAIIVADLQGRLQDVNAAGCRMFGYNREELLTMHATDLVADAEMARVGPEIARLNTGTVSGSDWECRRKDGTPFPAEASATVLSDGRVLGILRDVTERKRVQEALRTSEARLREAQQLAKLAHATIAMDGSFESWSEMLPDILGTDLARMPKSSRKWLTIVHPDDRDAFRGLSIESTKRGKRFEMEYRLRRGDGAWINVRHVTEPIRDDSGAAGRTRWIGTVQDVTAHRRDAALLAGQRRTLEMIASGAPIAESLTTLIRALEEIIPDAVGSVLLIDDDGLHLRHGAAPGLPRSYIEAIDGVAIGPRVGSCGTAAYRRERVVVGDIVSDPLWEDFRDLALRHGLRACWSIPILDAERRVLGTFAIYFREPRFPAEEELRVVEALTHTAAVAIEKARDEAALGDASARLRELSRRLLEAQETERRSIARELHDEVGGVLTAVKLNLQSLRGKPAGRAGIVRSAGDAALADGLALVDGAIQSVRSLSLDLHPAVLDDLGLIPALQWYCGRTAQRADVLIELALQPIDLKAAPQLEIACFRIVQEAVTNALRHAKASSVRVALRRSDGSFVLEITDDGAGFDASAARKRALAGESSGLLGMEERVTLLSGRFGIDSAPGAGTRVRASFAVPEGGFA